VPCLQRRCASGTNCLVNPLLLFLSVWGATLALYLAGVLTGTFPSPHGLTVAVLLLNLATFSLGYLTWALLQGLAPPQLDRPRLGTKPLTPQRLRRVLAFTLLMGVAALLLMLHRVSIIAAHNNLGFWALLTNPYLLRLKLVLFIAAGVSQTNVMIMLISLTSGLFSIGFVLLGVFLYVDTTARRFFYLLAFLLIALAMCLMNLSRYDMTMSILYLILAYGVMSVSARGERLSDAGWRIGDLGQRRRTTRDLLLPVVAVVIIFAAIELLLRKSATYGESGSLRSVLFSFYWYLASPTAALNEFLSNFQGDWGLGQKTFFPFYKWLHRLHLVSQPTISVYGEFVHIPYPANVYTYLRNFYEDFGLLGVVLVPYGLGWVIAAIKDRATGFFPFLNAYVLLLVPILFSFYSYPLLSSQFYLQILFGFLFFRYEMLDESHVET
jgi:oligosaccharide repeat unit polymerase